MQFHTQKDLTLAGLAVIRWLPRLVVQIESGIRALGLTITKKYIQQSADGVSCPFVVVRSPRAGWTIELGLRNSLEELLTIDRDEKPARFDVSVLDPERAKAKLDDIVAGRLAIVKALATSRSAREAERKMKRLARRFAYLRMWRIDPPAGGPGTGGLPR